MHTKAKEHPLYGTWSAMLGRVRKGQLGQKHCYKHVSVHEPWTERAVKIGGHVWTFPPGLTRFAEWIDENLGPCEGRSLDRIDNTIGYVPGNLRWATRLEQQRNRRTGWIKPTAKSRKN